LLLLLLFFKFILDFVQEGQNAERIRTNFANDPEFTTPEIEWVTNLQQIQDSKITEM
jgi:predicted unusual protein kinase regulating ubiquinone biosynthesis (AarF/ABC1/UbiB family)